MASGNVAKTTVSLTAQNTFSDGVAVVGDFNVSISGTFVATVWLQRSFDDGSNWMDVESQTAPAELIGTNPEPGVLHRLGIKTGGFTSGTVVGRISQ